MTKQPIPKEAEKFLEIMRDLENTMPWWLKLIIGQPNVPRWVTWKQDLENGRITWPELKEQVAAIFERAEHGKNR